MTETYTRDSDKIEIPAEWIESGKRGEILYNKKALKLACNQTLDTFVAELEKQSALGTYCQFPNTIELIASVNVIKQTAKRMKGDV